MMKLTKWLLAIIALIIIGGCPDGSSVVRLISGMEIELFDNGAGSERLDVWNTDGDDGGAGKEGVRGAGFGFICRLEDSGIPLAGIKIEGHIISHHDPLDNGWDIWDEYAPNGEMYGYVHPLPNGAWDHDDGIAAAYTNSVGECIFLIGLGDPDVGFGGEDDGYLWPDYDDGVSTLVEVRFIIRKASGSIIHDCYVVFFRSQYQNFWEPYGGIFGNSFSSLNQWNGWSKSLDRRDIDTEIALDSMEGLELFEMELTEKFPYPSRSLDKSGEGQLDMIVVYDPNCVFIAGTLIIDPNCPWIIDPNCPWPDIVNPIPDPNCPGYMIDPDCLDYPDPNCPWIPDPNCLIIDPNCYILDPDCPWIPGSLVPDPNCYSYFDPNENNPSGSDLPMFGEGWKYLDGVWRKWYPGYGWYYVNGMVATWIADLDDPDEVMLAMDLSQPYVFLCSFEVEDIENVQVWSHTGMVRSVDSAGQKVSQLPVGLYVYGISGNVVYLASNFILPMEFPEQQGEYYDRWGNPYAAIYVPEGGYLEIVKDDFYGDFNFDGDVNNEDYGAFAIRWNDDVFRLHDPNFAYDLMYDADYDGQTDVSDLMYFSDNWLEIR